MIDIEKLKKEIVERLKPLNLEKIILFGSYAYGNPNEDSDIDLYVVTKDDFIPQSFKENGEVYLKVSRLIREIRYIIPVDLIVHTRAMYHRFGTIGSSFAKELLKDGVVLYEV